MIKIQNKYGCLTVLDMGEEYAQSEKYLSYLEERESLINENLLYQSVSDSKEKIKLLKQYSSSSFMFDLKNNPSDLDRIFAEFIKHRASVNNSKLSDIKSKLETHYKCQCKCGKIHYYNAKTIESNPKYCFYPVFISTRHTYSTKAQNAKYRKQEKYADLESVVLCDKSECMPSADYYCGYYNAYKIKQLEKKEEKLRLEIANIPRVYAKNYDVDFVGKQYESLYIEECCNEYLESEPTFSYSPQHHKHWHPITVYKQYKCRCILCGKEQYVNCDKFGVYPPTNYGYHAYNGYWSEVSCECHSISSFQWIVNKLLIENNVSYQVEYSFPDLYGCFGKNKLRFDFAILSNDGSVKCLVECQGEQHYKPVKEFGGKYKYDIQIKNDNLKKAYVKKHNIQMIEISYKHKKIEKIETILKENNII